MEMSPSVSSAIIHRNLPKENYEDEGSSLPQYIAYTGRFSESAVSIAKNWNVKPKNAQMRTENTKVMQHMLEHVSSH